MREYMGIFRGKRLDNGEWVEGAYYKHDAVKVCFASDDPKTEHLIIADGFCDWGLEPALVGHEVDPDTVGECTGLSDKNGRLIFEGDILRLYEEETEHEADGYCVIHFGRFKDTDALSDFDYLGWHITVTTIPNEATTVFALEEQGLAFEIISNIHDNPELLKGGEDNATD